MSKLYALSVVAINGGTVSHFALFEEFNSESEAISFGYEYGNKMYPNSSYNVAITTINTTNKDYTICFEDKATGEIVKRFE